jgi:hypothetical protein
MPVSDLTGEAEGEDCPEPLIADPHDQWCGTRGWLRVPQSVTGTRFCARQTNTWQYVLAKWGSTNGYAVGVGPAFGAFCLLNNSLSTQSPVTTGVWHHIAIARDLPYMVQYLDGVAVHTVNPIHERCSGAECLRDRRPGSGVSQSTVRWVD